MNNNENTWKNSIIRARLWDMKRVQERHIILYFSDTKSTCSQEQLREINEGATGMNTLNQK